MSKNQKRPLKVPLVDPASIPKIISDPIPFQRTVMAPAFGWQEEMFRETWDEELLQYVHLFSLARLDNIMDSLQRYSTAYNEGDVVVVDCSGMFKPDGGKE